MKPLGLRSSLHFFVSWASLSVASNENSSLFVALLLVLVLSLVWDRYRFGVR